MSDSTRRLVAALAATFGAAQLAHFAVPGKFRSHYKLLGQRYGVDPNILHALALQETREQPHLTSAPNRNGTVDYGLMQINGTNLARYGLTPTTALDPVRSIDAAARLIRDIYAAMPHAGVLDVFSIYNAGQSTRDADPVTPGHQVRAKYSADGLAYFNQPYVQSAMVWYLLVIVASAAPVRTWSE